MGFSIDSRLKDLIADERARKVLIKHLGQRNDPQMDMVLYYSLREIATYPEANISREKLQAIDEELKTL
ncbi:MAG: hypothetical protein JW934_11385 [Anaerolineae bacterium]|nr:hypothetical protein [Anaerolineae bacterium]